MNDFGERYRDAIEAGAAALDQWLGAADMNPESAAAVAWHVAHLEDGVEAVLLAATTEIDCPAAWYFSDDESSCDDHHESCACGGSAVLRVLPTTETEK